MRLDRLTDLDLVARARAGDDRAADTLVRRWESWALHIARPFFTRSGSREDIAQEARLGILNAIRNYDPDGSAFRSFVALCVHRHLVSMVKQAEAMKHQPLSDSLRTVVMQGSEGDEVVEAVQALSSPGADPALVFERREELRQLARLIRIALSPLEARCLLGYANGLSYEQMAEREGAAVKSIDQALCRARWKLRGDGPPSVPKMGAAPSDRLVYVCPTCGGETVKRKKTAGRPPRCNVCQFKAAA